MQKGEATRVIYLHELLWLSALWLDAEIYAIDARVYDLYFNDKNEQQLFYEVKWI